jgi:hypothetical protein
VQFSQQLDIPKAKVFRFSGFTKKDEFDIDNTEIFDNIKDPLPQREAE